MILKIVAAKAIYGHCDMMRRVDLVREYLALVEDGEVGVAIEVPPEQEPIAKMIVSVLGRFKMEHAGTIVGVNRLSAPRIVSGGQGNTNSVYYDCQVGMRMIEVGNCYAPTQIVREFHRVWRSWKQEHRGHDYCDENHHDGESGQRSLSSFLLDIPQNLLFPGLRLRHRMPSSRRRTCSSNNIFGAKIHAELSD